MRSFSVSGQCGDWRNWFTERQSAELRGAYRVSVAGAHRKTLQYGEDTSMWGTDNSKPRQASEPSTTTGIRTLKHNRHQTSEAQQTPDL